MGGGGDSSQKQRPSTSLGLCVLGQRLQQRGEAERLGQVGVAARGEGLLHVGVEGVEFGAALLDSGSAKEAEAVYREDLRRNPDNGWALRGLAGALAAQGKAAEAKAKLLPKRSAGAARTTS